MTTVIKHKERKLEEQLYPKALLLMALLLLFVLFIVSGTVRRFLEKYGSDIDAIVFVCDEETYVSLVQNSTGLQMVLAI